MNKSKQYQRKHQAPPKNRKQARHQEQQLPLKIEKKWTQISTPTVYEVNEALAALLQQREKEAARIAGRFVS